MSDNGLKPGEILCPAQRVKYHRIEYHEGYVIIEGHTPEKREAKENNIIQEIKR